MKKYEAIGGCSKCGWEVAISAYRPPYNADGEIPNRPIVPEAIIRICGRCGYKWEELPLDSKEKDNG